MSHPHIGFASPRQVRKTHTTPSYALDFPLSSTKLRDYVYKHPNTFALAPKGTQPLLGDFKRSPRQTASQWLVSSILTLSVTRVKDPITPQTRRWTCFFVWEQLYDLRQFPPSLASKQVWHMQLFCSHYIRDTSEGMKTFPFTRAGFYLFT